MGIHSSLQEDNMSPANSIPGEKMHLENTECNITAIKKIIDFKKKRRKYKEDKKKIFVFNYF